MSNNSKNDDTLRIEISHFNSSFFKQKENSNKDSDQTNLNDNTMKISIEGKSMKKSVINVNLNDSDKQNREQIKIKIGKKEKSKRENNKSGEKINSKNNMNLNLQAQPPVEKLRKDVFGNFISKGSKKRVTFLDLLKDRKEDLVRIINVESFKSFNVDMSLDNLQDSTKTKVCCGKSCLIY